MVCEDGVKEKKKVKVKLSKIGRAEKKNLSLDMSEGSYSKDLGKLESGLPHLKNWSSRLFEKGNQQQKIRSLV